jgi:hypothetical protein
VTTLAGQREGKRCQRTAVGGCRVVVNHSDHEVANFSFHLRPMLFPKDTMQLDDESSSASWWMRDARDGLLGD